MPPHGYIMESEDYYDPNTGSKNTVEKAFGKNAISSNDVNNPTFVKKGMPPKVIL